MRKSARTQIPPFFDNDPYTHRTALGQVHFVLKSANYVIDTIQNESLKPPFIVVTRFYILSISCYLLQEGVINAIKICS